MKTSIDLPDDLYRRIKSKSALQGRAVREVATALFTAWVNEDGLSSTASASQDGNSRSDWLSDWKRLGTVIDEVDVGTPGLVDQLRADRR